LLAAPTTASVQITTLCLARMLVEAVDTLIYRYPGWEAVSPASGMGPDRPPVNRQGLRPSPPRALGMVAGQAQVDTS